MNGFSGQFCKAGAARAVGALGIALTLALALGGCADLRRSVSLPPVNPESPVAAIVQPASTRSYAVPRLSDVPPLPKNVASADVVKVGVVSMVRCRAGLERFAVTHPPLTGNTAQFAANEREVAQINPADVPDPGSAGRTDAFAAGLRAEAAPPPAIASGPAPTADQGRPPTGAAPRPASAAKPHPRGSAPRAPTPSAPVQATATQPAPVQAAPATVVETTAGPPPLPGPAPDPLLARCT